MRPGKAASDQRESGKGEVGRVYNFGLLRKLKSREAEIRAKRRLDRLTRLPNEAGARSILGA